VTVAAATFLALNASESPKSSHGLRGADFGLPAQVQAPAESQRPAKAKAKARAKAGAPAAPAKPEREQTSSRSGQADARPENGAQRPERPAQRPERATQRPEKEQLAAAPAPAQGPERLDQPVRPAHPDRAVPTGPLPTPPAKKRERPTSAQAERLARGALADLSRARVAARARLARAKTAEGQSEAARALQRAYRSAMSRIGAIRPGDGRAQYASLEAALGTTASAYGRLAAAIATGDQRRYDAQRRAVVEGENAAQDAANAIFR
jgi:hypothetical protein